LANIINTFNINTNRWSKRYIFKRLRFLGSKHLSALGTLLFLAIWHGFHPGYLLCFGMEFIDMEAERRLLLLWRSIKGDQTFTAPVRILLSLIGWLWTFFHLSYGLSAMEQRTFDNAWRYWQRLYFLGFWISITGIVLSVLLTPLIQRSTTPDKAFVKPTQPKPQASARTT
jgi:lysophospholipid acyltransferase 5